MKEYRFRAWDKDKNIMFVPEYIDEDGNACNSSLYPYVSGMGFAEEVFAVENAILMQYTGIKDKNGKEIYEGDVLQSYCSECSAGRKDVVRFVNSGFWCGKDDDLWMPNSEHCEVLGNIYETPELLKEE